MQKALWYDIEHYRGKLVYIIMFRPAPIAGEKILNYRLPRGIVEYHKVGCEAIFPTQVLQSTWGGDMM